MDFRSILVGLGLIALVSGCPEQHEKPAASAPLAPAVQPKLETLTVVTESHNVSPLAPAETALHTFRTAPGMDQTEEVPRNVVLIEDAWTMPTQRGPGEFLPGIQLDLMRRRVSVTGYLALDRGALEYLACTPQGKTHESLLTLLCLPEHLNAALLAIDLKPLPQVQDQGEMKALEGDRLVIEVTWTENGRSETRRVEDLIYDYTRDASMPRVGWVYTGGRFIDDPRGLWEEDPEKKKQYGRVYSANLLGNIVATFHDPDAILDTPLLEGGNDEAFFAWYNRLPPRFTKLRVEIRVPAEGEIENVPHSGPPSVASGDSSNVSPGEKP